jgi:hypothetical protein
MAGQKGRDDEIAAELEASGIEVHRIPDFMRKGEVKTNVLGSLHGWKFERAWYYWRAEGPGIEVAAAEALHATHGREVRVAGHCGCPSPTEWYRGLAVGDYHVDTPAGLKALADTLNALVARTPRQTKLVGWQPIETAPKDRPILLDLSYYYDHDETPTEVYLVGEYVESDNGYVWDTGDEVFRHGAPAAWIDIPKTEIRRDAPMFVESKVTKRLRLRPPQLRKEAP